MFYSNDNLNNKIIVRKVTSNITYKTSYTPTYFDTKFSETIPSGYSFLGGCSWDSAPHADSINVTACYPTDGNIRIAYTAVTNRGVEITMPTDFFLYFVKD